MDYISKIFTQYIFYVVKYSIIDDKIVPIGVINAYQIK